MKWLFPIILLFIFVCCKSTIEKTVNTNKHHHYYKPDTLAILLVRIETADSIFYQRMAASNYKYTVENYCELMTTVLNDGVCDVCEMCEYYEIY